MRRRRVFRVAGLYVVGAWVALQVADLAFANWGIPPAAMRYLWVAALLGLPVALVFGWRYDIVEGRIVRTALDASAEAPSLRRTDILVLGALAAIIVATLYGVGAGVSFREPPVSRSTPPGATDPKAIAVLPFANMGDGPNADFLALGLQDDLLTRLSRIADLKVISRTSVERFRDRALSVPEIGRQLGVGRILEGSVLHAGDQIRVNVQLIDAIDDAHLWANTYDQTMTATGLFDIQTKIADAIVQELRATLTPNESLRLGTMPTASLDAYTAYLKAVQKADIESIEALNDAIAHYKAAIDMDQRFALAHVGLADAYLTLSTNFYGGLSAEESTALAEPPLSRALELDPELGQAYATLGLLRQQQGDFAKAQEAYETAIALRPNYPRVFRLYARLHWQQRRREDALVMAERALQLDPYSAPANFDMARYYDVTGRFDEALTRYLRVVEIEPDHAFAYVYIAAIHYLVYGRADESLVWYHKAAAHDALSPSLHAAPAIPYLELDEPQRARPWVEKGLELGPETLWSRWASLLLNVHAGDDEAAVQDARVLLERYPRFWGPLNLLRNADLAAGRYEVARSRYARAFRELVEPELPEVNPSNYFAAVDLALVLRHLGEDERADDLLQGSLETMDGLSRYGTEGYWITDVRIYALQERPERALAALREAVDGGWRILSWYYLDHDPNLASLREQPEFARLRQRVRADMDAQALRVRELHQSGELPGI